MEENSGYKNNEKLEEKGLKSKSNFSRVEEPKRIKKFEKS